MESETQKILGDLVNGTFRPLNAKVSRHCNRVPVVDGHTFASRSSSGISRMRVQSGPLSTISPPFRSSGPCPALRFIRHHMEQQDRPQPRRDAERENGMAVFVGRLRPCPCLTTSLSPVVTTLSAAQRVPRC